jgi:hypothetical protein
LAIISNILNWAGTFSRRTVWAVGAVGLGVAAGVVSAMYSLSVAGLLPPKEAQGWQEWDLDPDSLTLPYALGHFLAAQQMPPPRTAKQFIRKTDATGKSLRSDCIVTIAGEMPKSRWWTLGAATLNGKFNSKASIADTSTVVREGDNKVVINVSASPLPGNWLQPASNGAYMLILTLHDPSIDTGNNLPDVIAGGC